MHIRAAVCLGTVSGLLVAASALAFRNAGTCGACHGRFTGSVSPKGTVFPSGSKHEMHRARANMDTECELCHTEIGDDPFLASSAGTASTPGLGCSGCHVGSGLRAHHAAAGVTTCYTTDCHDPETAPPEDVPPPYYGTVDTRVDNPCNDTLAPQQGENWSVGDLVGLDNDGDNLYDLADLSCGPYRILGIEVVGSDARITWQTAGGRTDQLGAAADPAGSYDPVGGPLTIPGVGIVTTNRLDVGGAASPARAYRLEVAP